jgi:hypothetical protein
MSVLRAKHALRKQVAIAWAELNSSLIKMASDCDVRPNTVANVFTIDEGDDQSIKMAVNPVAFKLKEKTQSTKASFYVTVSGRVNFTIDEDPNNPLACFFATEVGYFRETGQRLDHVLGVHYDYDNKIAAHPIFHAQLTSCIEHVAIINEHFHKMYVAGNDAMEDVAKRVRLPTAHMDPLAVFVQLLADHLLNENSGIVERTAFEKARSALMFFKSDARRSARLDEIRQHNGCFRGPRWYPDHLPQVAAPAGASI